MLLPYTRPFRVSWGLAGFLKMRRRGVNREKAPAGSDRDDALVAKRREDGFADRQFTSRLKACGSGGLDWPLLSLSMLDDEVARAILASQSISLLG